MAKTTPTSAAPKDEAKEIEKVSKAPVNVEFIGDGADKIKFTVDPKAKRTRVYDSGIVVVDY